LPPDRLIVTASYEVKTEDESSADFDPKVYPACSGSREKEEREGEDEELVPKRRKTARTQNVRRVLDDDDEEVKHAGHTTDEDAQMSELVFEGSGREDFDEMAIGAEVKYTLLSLYQLAEHVHRTITRKCMVTGESTFEKSTFDRERHRIVCTSAIQAGHRAESGSLR